MYIDEQKLAQEGDQNKKKKYEEMVSGICTQNFSHWTYMNCHQARNDKNRNVTADDGTISDGDYCLRITE